MARERLEGVPLLEDFASVLARRLVPLEGDANGVVGSDLEKKTSGSFLVADTQLYTLPCRSVGR